MSHYGFFAKFKALEGKRDELISILLHAARSVATMKGCRQYIVYGDDKNKNRAFVSEIWDTKQDHDRSLTNQGSKDLIMKAMPLLDGKPEGTGMELAGGTSSFIL